MTYDTLQKANNLKGLIERKKELIKIIEKHIKKASGDDVYTIAVYESSDRIEVSEHVYLNALNNQVADERIALDTLEQQFQEL